MLLKKNIKDEKYHILLILIVDLNECESPRMYCEQYCNNNIGSYECSCGFSYTKSSDNVSCISDKINQGKRYRVGTGTQAS